MADGDDPLRRGLGPLWPAPEPADDFVDRVVARLDAPSASASASEPASARGRRGRWRTAGVVALSLALGAAAAAIVIGLRDGGRSGGGEPMAPAPAQGSLAATARATVQLGRRAVVVAHPGAVLAWSVAGDGAADVHLSAGEAFFRVERGGRFDVHTPSGDVRVVGTCFTVTVTRDVTTVDVHEGEVELRDKASAIALHPGERGHLGGDAPARRRPAPAATATGDTAAPTRSVARNATPAPSPRGDQCYCVSDPRHLEADQALRDEWAASCLIRADIPPVGDTADDLAPIDDAATKLGLVGDERKAFQLAALETTRFGLTRIAEIYTAATGESAAGVDLTEQIEQIDLTRTLGEDAHLRQAISRERAGHAPQKTDPAQMTPYEELYRLVIYGGDDLERRLADRLGAARAHELRMRFGGWPGRDFDWLGCPP